MNYLAAFTSALGVGAGIALQNGVIPPKYAGYSMIAAVMLQTFQSSIRKPAAPTPPQGTLADPGVKPPDSPFFLDGTPKS